MSEKMNSLSDFKQKASSFWQKRTAQERKLISICGIVLMVAFAYLLLIDPAFSGRKQLNKDLPTLRLEAAEMRVLSIEASKLASKTNATLPPMTSESIGTLLVKRGMRPLTVTVTGDFAKVQLADAPFTGVISWLDEIQKTVRISVVEANIVAQPTAGSVNATLTLRQQKSEQK